MHSPITLLYPSHVTHARDNHSSLLKSTIEALCNFIIIKFCNIYEGEKQIVFWKASVLLNSVMITVTCPIEQLRIVTIVHHRLTTTVGKKNEQNVLVFN